MSDARQTIQTILNSVQRDLDRILGEVRILDADASELQGRAQDFERHKADATQFVIQALEVEPKEARPGDPVIEALLLAEKLVLSAEIDIDRLLLEISTLKAARQAKAADVYRLERQKLSLMSQLLGRLRSSEAMIDVTTSDSPPRQLSISYSASSGAMHPSHSAERLYEKFPDHGHEGPQSTGSQAEGGVEGAKPVNPIRKRAGQPSGKRPFKAKPGGEAPRGFAAAVRDIAHRSIAEAGRPLQREAIVDDVTASGIPLPTSLLPQKISKILAMDRNLTNERGKGYSLKPEALERVRASLAQERDDAGPVDPAG